MNIVEAKADKSSVSLSVALNQSVNAMHFLTHKMQDITDLAWKLRPDLAIEDPHSNDPLRPFALGMRLCGLYWAIDLLYPQGDDYGALHVVVSEGNLGTELGRRRFVASVRTMHEVMLETTVRRLVRDLRVLVEYVDNNPSQVEFPEALEERVYKKDKA